MPIVGDNGQEFESFESCVNAISGDGTSEEEAKQICGSFEETDKDMNVIKRVTEYFEDREKNFDSDEINKSEMEDSEFENSEDEFITKNDERQIAYTIALRADRPDLEKDTFVAPAVEKMAHTFMEKFQDHNVEHQFDTDDLQIVESFIAPTDFELNGNVVKKNDWVVALKFLDEELWDLAKSGKLSGVSIEGRAKKIPKSEVQ